MNQGLRLELELIDVCFSKVRPLAVLGGFLAPRAAENQLIPFVSEESFRSSHLCIE